MCFFLCAYVSNVVHFLTGISYFRQAFIFYLKILFFYGEGRI